MTTPSPAPSPPPSLQGVEAKTEPAAASGWVRGKAATGCVVLVTLLVGALAYFSPVEYHNSDGAIALLGSQSILDSGTLKLDRYKDRPELAYPLEHDYRARLQNGSYYYYSFGVPIFSVPFVWLVNRMGLDMLTQEDEFRTQNLVSAMLCVLIFVVLHALSRSFLTPFPSLVISTLTVLGSSLMSTLGTGLWNTGFAVLFLSLTLLHLARRRGGWAEGGILSHAYLMLLLGAAFLCRPTAAFFMVALLAYLVLERGHLIGWVIAALGLVLASLVLLSSIDHLGWLFGYYSPRKVLPQGSLVSGLYGTLLSPSRGLLVWSPFLCAVVVGVVWKFPRLRRQNLFWLAVVWILVHVGVMSVRQVWWGGHSYGPRLLTEVVPAFLLLTCLVWREAGGTMRHRLSLAYLVLALPAVFIHSYQGLFNPHTVLWNKWPNVDDHPRYMVSWRYPQFLASGAAIGRRWIEHQAANLPVYSMRGTVAYDSRDAVFVDWYPAEEGWRWSRGDSAALIVYLGEVEGESLHLVELDATAVTPQEVAVTINDTPVGTLALGGREGPLATRRRVLALPGYLLRPYSENRIRFDVGSPSSTADDSRFLGLALRSFSLSPLKDGFAEVTFNHEGYFVDGWSDAESGWRWTSDEGATLVYPMERPREEGSYALSVLAGAFGDQRVTVHLNGVEVGEMEFEGFEPAVRKVFFPGRVLAAQSLNEVKFEIPGAQAGTGDTRRLGIKFVSMTLESASADGGVADP